FLVMEFLEGMPGWTLRHRIKNEGGLDVAEAVPLFGNYLGALHFLHHSARPIIHRDIKPGNLYAPMGQPDKAKIFDLGVARDVSGTVTVGGVPGTLDYMAPEFAEAGGDRGSPQSDLYALGLCLYEALTGKPVFERLPTDMNSAWVAFQDRIRKPPQIAFDDEVFARYPRLKQVVSRTLCEKPAQRYAGAAEMRAALEDALKPETMSPERDDDLFDAGEMTMATLAGGQPPAEPGMTLGTRPLELADATLAAPGGGLVEAGRREAERRRTRKRLLLAGVAAGVAAVGVGGVLLGIRVAGRRGGGTPAQPDRVPQPHASIHAPSQPVPEPKAADGAPAGAQPKPQQAATALPPERDPVYQNLLKAIPGALDDDAAWLAAEAAAGRLAAQANETWPGLDEAERTRRLAALQERLTSLAAEGVKRLRDAALAELAAGRDGKADRERLSRLAAQSPRLKALLAPALEDAAAQVDRAYAAYAEGVKREQEQRRKAAEEQAERQKAERQKAEAQAARLARAAGLLDTLDAQLRDGGLEACRDGVAVLGGATPELLADAPFKARWEASRAACAKRVAQTLAQKEPLEERARRLEAMGEVLGHAAAEAVFGAEAAELRRALEQQKSLGLLRLVNRSKSPLLLTSRELGLSGGALAGGEAKEWLLPVKGETLTVSVAVRGDDRFRSRIETVKLTPGSGIERAFGEGDAGLLTPKAEETPVAAEVAPAPVAPAPVAPAPAPAPAQEVPAAVATPAPVAAAPAPATVTAKGAFEITVSPKTAQVLLDGLPVPAGRHEVSANENHQIAVESKGYKTVQQYYKVKPDETRRIDILLEKEEKRSFFGF
ncbi:MAG: protein kinase, partial [Kiritimatiellae bacterium]|nr:protein kinase [Kiritimatiellia bacterium]